MRTATATTDCQFLIGVTDRHAPPPFPTTTDNPTPPPPVYSCTTTHHPALHRVRIPYHTTATVSVLALSHARILASSRIVASHCSAYFPPFLPFCDNTTSSARLFYLPRCFDSDCLATITFFTFHLYLYPFFFPVRTSRPNPRCWLAPPNPTKSKRTVPMGCGPYCYITFYRFKIHLRVCAPFFVSPRKFRVSVSPFLPFSSSFTLFLPIRFLFCEILVGLRFCSRHFYCSHNLYYYYLHITPHPRTRPPAYPI
ncbi:hypothetical protein C8R46DRAFT_379384 [Mycena filopes]|nr:hypothetical protein C8R46DRAFT_379384 [Mycena filopes]